MDVLSDISPVIVHIDVPEDFFLWIKYIQRPTFSTDPDKSLVIFAEGPYHVLTEACGIVGPVAIGFKETFSRVILVNSIPGDPDDARAIFCDGIDSVTAYASRIRRVVLVIKEFSRSSIVKTKATVGTNPHVSLG